MTDWLINLDHSITLGLNGMHTPFWNEVMLFLSAKTVWIPLYAAIAILFFVPRWYGKKSQAFISGSRIPLWLTGLIGVVAVLLCFGLTEQITNIVKDLAARPRPGHEPLLEGLLQLPEGKGGRYGFFSAHAANTFGLAILTALIFRRKWYSVFIVLWAAAVSFSRIYLAKHFTTDVLCGAVAGILIGMAVYYLYKYILSLISRKYTRTDDLHS